MTSIITFDVFPHVFCFEDSLTLKARELKQRFELGHKQNGANVYPSNFSCLITENPFWSRHGRLHSSFG